MTEAQRAAVALVRHLIWWFYRDLKLYRTDPSARARASLKARFDRIFTRTTGFAELDAALARLKRRKPELLIGHADDPAEVALSMDPTCDRLSPGKEDDVKTI